ncbi:hypothetical protein AALO_G00033660 [Alosa alosa]|uniref:Uncharacterized protein n=1 Tax=Alosa alosa TaxID=278164 RepID=A0AAV6HGJ2_9TELE|nr:hypothetical protein AALO_G00033660 [Alosa alosa]
MSLQGTTSPVDTLVPRVEALLDMATALQSQCRTQSEQTVGLVAQLREEAQGLRRMGEETQQDMTDMRQRLDELMDTKAAFDAKERQSRKLSRQF